MTPSRGFGAGAMAAAAKVGKILEIICVGLRLCYRPPILRVGRRLVWPSRFRFQNGTPTARLGKNQPSRVGKGRTGRKPSKERGIDMSDVADRVKKIVVEHLGVEEDKVTESASFIDDLGADSLDTVELVMAFEEEFGIEIPDDAAETIQTFGDAVKFISEAS